MQVRQVELSPVVLRRVSLNRAPAQVFHMFLVLGMFLTGSLNTIVSKAADQ